MAVAPEHQVVEELLNSDMDLHKKTKIREYVKSALNKSERERKVNKEKTGVDTGIKVMNPANGNEVPLWVADYVMMDIGTGAVMGVPGHDERDWEVLPGNTV